MDLRYLTLELLLVYAFLRRDLVIMTVLMLRLPQSLMFLDQLD